MNASISDLVAVLVEDSSGFNDEPEITLLLELADEINASNQSSRVASGHLVNIISTGRSYQRWKALRVIEFLTKNCGNLFHRYLLNPKFCMTALKILEKRRGKLSILNPLISTNKQIQRSIEDKLLFLIQIWADTFMLHEEEYKPLMSCYRKLRKEGVAFPERKIEHKGFVKFDGKPSPVYDVLEEGGACDPKSAVNFKTSYTVKEAEFLPGDRQVYTSPPTKYHQPSKSNFISNDPPLVIDITLDDLSTIVEAGDLLKEVINSESYDGYIIRRDCNYDC